MSDYTRSELMSWVKTIILAIAFAYLINNFILVNAKVPTGSMENNIMSNDRIVANRLAYLFSNPKRMDIVIFRYPDDEDILFVKRIIGLPGELVEIRGGKVYIDGAEEPLDDSFVKEIPIGDSGPYVVPAGHYFMLGDNRNNSQDSRLWRNTYVAKEKILGKVLFKYYKGFEMIR